MLSLAPVFPSWWLDLSFWTRNYHVVGTEEICKLRWMQLTKMQNANTFYKELVSLSIPPINLFTRFKTGERGRKSFRGCRGWGVGMKRRKTYLFLFLMFCISPPQFCLQHRLLHHKTTRQWEPKAKILESQKTKKTDWSHIDDYLLIHFPLCFYWLRANHVICK